ncbi:MAG: thioredoxin domain-containing protein [bacterium]
MKMKKAALFAVIALAAAVCYCKPSPDKPAPEPAEQPEKEPAPARVRPAVADGSSLAVVFKSIEKNLDRLSREAELLKHKPSLKRDKTYEFDTAGAPTKGPEDADIKVVAFTDFECPACAKFASTMKKIVKKFPDHVSITVMNFPLNKECNPMLATRMHPRACFLAELAMAAHDQEKYWTMHDYIFGNRSRVRRDNIKEFAKRHGMEGEKLLQAVQEHKYKQKIQDQARQLAKTGKRGTPAVFINGMEVKKPAWHNAEKTESFIKELISPEREEEPVQKTVSDPASLPAAAVVLEDGTSLDERLRRVLDKLENIRLRRERESSATSRQSNPRDPDRKYPFHLENRPGLGPEDAPVTVVAFLDLLSAHTERMVPVLREVHNEYPEKARIVFKFKPRARRDVAGDVHVIALEAWRQGKFHELLDLVLEQRRDLTEQDLANLAKEAGLDMEAYKKALDDNKARRPLIKDLQDARHARVKRTPAVFVNGKFLPEVNKSSILEAIEKKVNGGD